MKAIQIGVNVLLYGFLLWLLYDSTLALHFAKKEMDLWFAFVVAFVLALSIVISLIPGVRAKTVSPGAFPYDDDK